MYRSKDFYMKTIYNAKGKKLGSIKDIYVNLDKKIIDGFEVSNYSFLGKKNFLNTKDINYFEKDKVVGELSKGNGVKFSFFRNIDVVDCTGRLKGVVDDIIVDEESYEIKGIAISPGIIEKVLKGKDIVLPRNIVVNEGYILDVTPININFKNIWSKGINNEFY